MVWKRFVSRWRVGGHVLGINARNLSVIYPKNPRRGFRKVDDKLLCKTALESVGVPVPRTLFVVEAYRDLRGLNAAIKPLSGFVVKPANASGGKGILVVRRRPDGSMVATGARGDRSLTEEDVGEHIAQILAGLVNPARLNERVFLEQLLEPDDVLGGMAYKGLPDVRLIMDDGRPVMAMVRVPTRRSAGRANLHQGAIGLGVDLDTGRTSFAILGNRSISNHPDTRQPLTPVSVPFWEKILDMSKRSASCVDLGYIGVDLIIDRRLGPVVIELNARPGLNIQLANRRGLRPALGLMDS